MNELTTTTTTTKPSALSLMAERCQVEPAKLHATLKNTVFKGATDDELLALVVTANSYGLNPLLKELYAFPKKGGGITPMVGIDGWLKIANRQPNYDGMDVEVFGADKNPTHATCEIYLKDRAHSVKITEYFEECKRGTDPWNQMPRRMLRNKAIIQAIRVAFGIGGIHDEDEAADISSREPRNVTKPAQRLEVIDPFTQPEEMEVVEAELVKKEPEGKQKKARHERNAIFKEVNEKEANGKTWFEVSVGISGKSVTLTTFSQTMADRLRELEKGEQIRATIVQSGEGFALEDFEIITATEGGLI